MNSRDFAAELVKGIAVKREELDRNILPQLQQNYISFISVVKILRENLLKKGLIYDDPYKYDSRMTEIKVPSTEAFAEGERATVIGSRLAQYQTMLEFLINSYQFNYGFLTPRRVSSMVALNKTFQWVVLNDSTANANTRALLEISKSLQSASGTLSVGILRDSLLSSLAKLDNEIHIALNILIRTQREEYKLQVRNAIPDDVSITQSDVDSPAKIIKILKKEVSSKDAKLPFYNDLVLEVLREDYSSDSEYLQKSVLAFFAKTVEKAKKANEPKDVRPMLFNGLKVIGTTAGQFEICLGKIKFNQDVLYKSHTTIFSKFVAALKESLNIAEKKHEIPIIVKDAITNVQKKEVVVMEEFEQDLLQKIRIFKNLSGKNAVVQQKLNSMKNEQLTELLTKYIALSSGYIKTLTGLDEYYRTVDLLLRSKVKGIKIELTTIKNSIIKANQYKAEYTAAMEENAQMQRLGV